MRESIYARIDRLWAWDNYSHSRWYPIKEMILRTTGVDPMTKIGKKELRAFDLKSDRCVEALRAMSDGDLLDLYELTARRFAIQM